MGKTFAEKIFATKANREEVVPGETVTVKPDVVMTLDADAEVFYRFKQLGLKKVWDAKRIVCSLDHYAPASTIRTANLHKTLREFVKDQGIKYLYDVGEGLAHELMLEKGHVMPGYFVIGTDSHTPSYGCVGAFSCGVGATDMLSIWATGKLWFKVPESVKITISGKMPYGVYAKDIILEIIRNFTAKGCTYDCVEFFGDTLMDMSMAERFVLANLSVEMGAKATYVQFDDVTRTYVERNHKDYDPIFPDQDAIYKKHFELNAEGMEPMVACPHSVDNVKSIKDVGETQIHQAFIGTCTSGRLEDFEVATKILEGNKISPRVRLLIAPASRSIFEKAMELGYVQALLSAGATFLAPGCGPCAGIHEGLLGDGERCISTANRNFIGRMGSRNAEIYLGSTATVAASALRGALVDPREFL